MVIVDGSKTTCLAKLGINYRDLFAGTDLSTFEVEVVTEKLTTLNSVRKLGV